MQCFELWKSAIMDQSVTFRKGVYSSQSFGKQRRHTMLQNECVSCLQFQFYVKTRTSKYYEWPVIGLKIDAK